MFLKNLLHSSSTLKCLYLCTIMHDIKLQKVSILMVGYQDNLECQKTSSSIGLTSHSMLLELMV